MLLPTMEAAPRVKTGDFFTAYLKISEGCNHKCAFCIIPKIRGLHESRGPDDIVAEAHALAEVGVRELNLIAQDLTAYGRDFKPQSSLAELLPRLADVAGIRWIRLLYCYPNFVTDELLETIAKLPEVVKYIDMPLQHADDAMLRAMRRERSGAALSKLLERVRRKIPGVALRTSFIVGFPGEDDAAFANLLDFVKREQFDRVGVFTYSREENTDAFPTCPGRCPSRLSANVAGGADGGAGGYLIAQRIAVPGGPRYRGFGRGFHDRARHAASRANTGAGARNRRHGDVLRGEAQPVGFCVSARVERALSYDLHAVVTGAIVN